MSVYQTHPEHMTYIGGCTATSTGFHCEQVRVRDEPDQVSPRPRDEAGQVSPQLRDAAGSSSSEALSAVWNRHMWYHVPKAHGCVHAEDTRTGPTRNSVCVAIRPRSSQALFGGHQRSHQRSHQRNETQRRSSAFRGRLHTVRTVAAPREKVRFATDRPLHATRGSALHVCVTSRQSPGQDRLHPSPSLHAHFEYAATAYKSVDSTVSTDRASYHRTQAAGGPQKAIDAHHARILGDEWKPGNVAERRGSSSCKVLH